MNTSLFPKSLYTTRLMILGLAYFGYRLIDTTECMVVEDCSNADAANSSQPVSPPRKTHSNIVPADAFDEPFTSEDLAKAELDESVETNRLGFFDRLFGAEPSGAVVMATSIEPGGFSDANVLHMLEDIIWLLIRDDKIALRLTTLIKNRFCESDTNVGDNSAPSITAVESLNKDVPPVTIPPSEQIERIAHAEKPSSNLRKSGVQETEAALSPTATDGTKPATEGDTCNSRSFTTVSPGRFYRFISRLGTPISAVAYVYTRSVVGYLIKTNTAQFVFNGIVSFLVRFLYGANGNTGEVKGPMSVIVPDESCFQEKLSRLNTFYLNNTDLYLRTIGGYIFYGALPDSLDIVHATPPFETVTCVSTSKYVVTSPGTNAPSYVSSIITSLLIV
ncbi:putative membrane protein [Babesia divergens]|uniref:Membrane protein n=1 Tax=Babesia divergens TaxID=32595 RepID=A0AAD9G6I7_BABDI|nr:putative membrane protein [Babesia divergens]